MRFKQPLPLSRSVWLPSLATIVVAISVACSPATERPLRGTVPGFAYPTPTVGVPPTLASLPDPRLRALPDPSPGLAASPSPSASVVAGAPPIVRTIQPPQGATVPVGGAVTVSAVLVGRSADLSTASLVLDGVELPAQTSKANPRTWTIQASVPASQGAHTARVSVRDAAGVAGGFTWQFTVGEPPTPVAEEPPAAPPPPEPPAPPPAAATATPNPPAQAPAPAPKPKP